MHANGQTHFGALRSSGKEVARSLYLTAHEIGVTTRIDLVEAEEETPWVRPIDYKRGKAPDLVEGAWPADRVQVCAQALVLREHGYQVRQAGLWYAGSNKRVYVAIDDALIAQTLTAAAQLRAAVADAMLPPPLVASSKCDGCSLAPICLPHELSLLHNPVALSLDLDDRLPRRLIPARDDAMPVHIATPGAKVGLSGDELVVSGRESARIPLSQVLHVAMHGGSHISGPALTRLLSKDIPVAFLSQGGWFYGVATGLPHGNVALRQAQHAAAIDVPVALTLAKRLVVTKIRNQRHVLRRNAARDEGSDQTPAVASALRQMSEAADAAANAADLAVLIGCEGSAARAYFSVFSAMLGDNAKFAGFDFNGRNRRPPADPTNAVLSFLYAMLAREWTHVLWRIGLEPLLGFLHQTRHGRPALASDMMEEFRPIIADSVAITLLN